MPKLKPSTLGPGLRLHGAGRVGGGGLTAAGTRGEPAERELRQQAARPLQHGKVTSNSSDEGQGGSGELNTPFVFIWEERQTEGGVGLGWWGG